MNANALPGLLVPGQGIPGVGRFTPTTPPPIEADSNIFAGVVTWEPQVSSSRGGVTLAEEIPLVSGSVTESIDGTGSQAVLSITVPRFWQGVDWAPGIDALAPLADYGQMLTVAVLTGAPGGALESYDQGHFQILDHEVSADGKEVTVTGRDTLAMVASNRPTVVLAPRAGATMASEAVRLAGGRASVVIGDGLPDRAVPMSMSWGTERLDAWREIAAAWPARLRVDAFGTVHFLPLLPDVPTPKWRMRHGEGGTIVSAPQKSSRTGRPNLVTARGVADSEDRPAFQVTARVESGPASANGPYGRDMEYIESRLLTTLDRANDAAVARLNEAQRTRQVMSVTCASDPRIAIDDACEVEDDTGRKHWGYVVARSLPLTADDPEMRVDVGVKA